MTPQELRNSILRKAMSGKLLERSTNYGNAGELLETIQKARKATNIKENKKIKDISEDEIPFDIPENWQWVRFGSIVNYNMGKTPPRAELEWWGKDVPWVSIADMPENGIIMSTKEQMANKTIAAKFSNRISPKGTLLMSFKLTVGRVSLLGIDAVHNEAIISIFPICDKNNVIRNYLFNVLPLLTNYGDSKDAIKGRTLNDNSICNLLVPLPPLEEQKCIVEKIEELMPLVDKYEEPWTKLEMFNKQFPIDIEKSILQYAMQGKLVEQRAEEGTAEELYKLIQSEKQKLIKEGNIKKEKCLDAISPEEIPFDIPSTWKWVRMSSVLDVRDGTHDSPKYYTNGIPFITSKNLVDGEICFDTAKLISEEDAIKFNERSYVDNEDILFAMIGTIGNPVIVKKDREFCIKNVALIKNHNSTNLVVKYIYFYFLIVQKELKNSSFSSVQSFVSLNVLRNYLIPLPPLEEQKRIVAKIEELLPLCRSLSK